MPVAMRTHLHSTPIQLPGIEVPLLCVQPGVYTAGEWVARGGDAGRVCFRHPAGLLKTPGALQLVQWVDYPPLSCAYADQRQKEQGRKLGPNFDLAATRLSEIRRHGRKLSRVGGHLALTGHGTFAYSSMHTALVKFGKTIAKVLSPLGDFSEVTPCF